MDAVVVPPGEYALDQCEIVGYHDLDGRPGFKLAMQAVDDRWYLYMGHLWHRWWSVLDVTDLAEPGVAPFCPGRRTRGRSRSRWPSRKASSSTRAYIYVTDKNHEIYFLRRSAG